MNNQTGQRGFSLPELMVAILLGTIVTGAVIGMYLSTSRNFNQDERYALMQENGRYALKTLAADLEMSDFWGTMIAIDTATTALTPSGGDACAEGTVPGGDGISLFEFFPHAPLIYNNNHADNGVLRLPATWPCGGITAADVQRPNTGVLVIKRVEGSPMATGAAGVVRLRTNGVEGSFIDDGTNAVAPFTDWRYIPRIYFIRQNFDDVDDDGIPSLCRMDLSGTGMAGPTCIAEGIEDFHIQFGIDTDNDGVANRYLSSPTLYLAPPDVADIRRAVSARIFVLARSSDRDPAYTDVKTYVLGDETLAQGELTGANFYRRVFSTTVLLRNPVALAFLNN